MQTKLKVNVCSLMAESRIIRREVERFKRESELKGADPKCQQLIRHRRWHLRNEARAAQLLYAFVRGVPYRIVERTVDTDAYKWWDTWKRIKAKCGKLGLHYRVVVAWREGYQTAVPPETETLSKVG